MAQLPRREIGQGRVAEVAAAAVVDTNATFSDRYSHAASVPPNVTELKWMDTGSRQQQAAAGCGLQQPLWQPEFGVECGAQFAAATCSKTGK